MKKSPFDSQYSKSSKCEVCACLISYSDFLQAKKHDYLVCNSFDCRSVMINKSNMTSFQFENYLKYQIKLIETKSYEAVIKNKNAKILDDKEKKKNEKMLRTFLEGNPRYSEENFHLMRLPSGLTKLAAPSVERIKNYSEHLKRVIQETINNINNDTLEDDLTDNVDDSSVLFSKDYSEASERQLMADRLCEACKGGCCVSGGDHAYISASTIAELLKTKPELSQTDIYELYLSKIENKTIVGACINQTKFGCSLTREMRSDTCNNYFCEPVKSYLENESLEDIDKQKMVFAVKWSNTNWNRYDYRSVNEITEMMIINKAEILPIS